MVMDRELVKRLDANIRKEARMKELGKEARDYAARERAFLDRVKADVGEQLVFERAVRVGREIGALDSNAIEAISNSPDGRAKLAAIQRSSERLLAWFHAVVVGTTATVMTNAPEMAEAAGLSPREIGILALSTAFGASIVSVIARADGMREEIKSVLQRIEKTKI